MHVRSVVFCTALAGLVALDSPTPLFVSLGGADGGVYGADSDILGGALHMAQVFNLLYVTGPSRALVLTQSVAWLAVSLDVTALAFVVAMFGRTIVGDVPLGAVR
jgi:hypothetical protein